MRNGKEMIVIDDFGVTLKSNTMIGPIPWDCIMDAHVLRILFEKHLTVTISNVSKLEGFFGKETVRKKCFVDKETGIRGIHMDLDHCKLKGVDLEALINGRAKGTLAPPSGSSDD